MEWIAQLNTNVLNYMIGNITPIIKLETIIKYY